MSKSQEKPLNQSVGSTAPDTKPADQEPNEQAESKAQEAVNDQPVTTPPPKTFPPQVQPEQMAIAEQQGRKVEGIPSADAIRSMRRADPDNSIDPWMDATRNALGDYLRNHADLLNQGTELEYSYPASNVNDLTLWAQHYIKFQAELQKAGYRVFMIGQAGNPHLRIKLDAPRNVVAESK